MVTEGKKSSKSTMLAFSSTFSTASTETLRRKAKHYRNMTTAATPGATVPVTPRFMSATRSNMMDIQAMQPATGTMSMCEACYRRSIELQRMAMKLMMIENQKIMRLSGIPALEPLLKSVYEQLTLPEPMLVGTTRNGGCEYCGMQVEFLRKHAMLVLQSASFAPFLTQSMMPNTMMMGGTPAQRVTMTQAEPTAYANTRRPAESGSSKSPPREPRTKGEIPKSPASPTAAMFFAKAAEKFNIPKKKSRRSSTRNRFNGDGSIFPTNFSQLILQAPPPNPPGLFRYMGRRVDGKVNVMLRLSQQTNLDQTSSFIDVDQRRKQITIIPPKNTNFMSQKAQMGMVNGAPKMFAFDAIFESDMSQSRIAATSVLDVVHAVINGGDGCLLVYGASDVGKTHSMVGMDDSPNTAGIIPSAIAWLYSLIEDSKQRTGARVAVRVSAVEVVGKSENLRDLLSEQGSGASSASDNGTSPGIYLQEDLIGGVQLSNVKELRAATAEKAAFFLDAAVAARTKKPAIDNECLDTSELQSSHMLFTLHVYQYRMDKNGRSNAMCSGGRSRLHLIDLSCPQPPKDAHGSSPSLAALGSIIVALLNGMKKVPYKDSKITQLLKDSIGDPTCRTTLVAHVSSDENSFNKTLQTITVVSKIHRSRRKRNKYASSSSDQSSCDESRRRRPHPAMLKTSGIDDMYGLPSNSDYNTSSAGEDSCDTVIYMGSGNSSDQNLTDNERPPSPNTFEAMKMKLSASSSDDDAFEPVPIDPPTDEIIERCKRLDEMVDASIDATPEEVMSYLSDKSPLNSPMPEEMTEPLLMHKNMDNIMGSPVDADNKIACDIDKQTSLIDTHDQGELLALDPTPAIDSAADSKVNPPVNVVSPLVIKDVTTNCDISSSNPLLDKILESKKTERPLLIPYGSDEDLNSEVPSEKELRKCEKRIAKLLKSTMGDEKEASSSKSDSLKSKSLKHSKPSYHRSHSSSSKLDGYISAPEASVLCRRGHRPVNAVKGVVRQQSADDANFDADKEKHDAMTAKEIFESLLKKKSDQYGSPAVDKSSMDHAQNRTAESSQTLGAVTPNCDKSMKVENISSDCESSEIVVDVSINQLAASSPSETIEKLVINDETDCPDNVRTPTSSPKIQNLDHIITVTHVPNFKVAPKPNLTTFSHSTPSTPAMHHADLNSIRNANNLTKASLNSLDWDSGPRLERSYSRDDTCSLMSVNESDAYDSDAYCSSYTASPAPNRRHRVGPARLRYRWSTVYEEEENKRDSKTDKKSPKKYRNDKKDRNDKGDRSPDKKDKKVNGLVKLEGSPRSKRSMISPSRLFPSPKSTKKSDSKSPDSRLRSPKANRKDERNQTDKVTAADKRVSVCSDASSGIGSSQSSQTPSVHSGDERSDYAKEQKALTPKPRRWLFGRSRSRKSSGYLSDGNIVDSARSSRRSRFFSSRSKSSLTDGHSSGYETVTECGANSCAEETDCESVSSKKKRRRFLGFRRRSTSDLNTSRGRVRRMNWFGSRGAMSDDEVQIKVYQIDGPGESTPRRRYKSSEPMNGNSTPAMIEQHRQRIADLKQQRSDLQSADCAYQAVESDHYVSDLQRDVSKYEQRVTSLKSHLQVVTCFDNMKQHKVTRI